MPKQPWKVELTIEADEAFGLVLRKLHEMAGVTDIRPILDGLGGTGPGAKRLEKAASASAQAKASGPKNLNEAVLKVMMQKDGPMHVHEIVTATGRIKSSISTAVYKLKKEGIIKSVGTGLYEMAIRPRDGQVVPSQLALPAPTKTQSGRNAQGAGPALMLVILQRHAAPLPSGALREQLGSQGIGLKSVSGIVGRAIRDKLIKRNGVGKNIVYELTSKGQHAAEAATVHGN